MSALAEALVAAQRRAIGALEKAYCSGPMDSGYLRARLDEIGATDAVDQAHLVAALDVIREHGAQAPAEPRPNGAAPAEPSKATDAQVKFAQSLFQRADVVGLTESDLRNLTREQVSQMIEQLKAGRYDPSEWDVPF